MAVRTKEDNLPILLDAPSGLQYSLGKLELIIVDDGSTDRTTEIFDAYERKISLIDTLRIDRPPKGWSPKKGDLSQAIKKAQDDIIRTADADCRPGPVWVTHLVRRLSYADVVPNLSRI